MNRKRPLSDDGHGSAEQTEPGGRASAPGRLALVQRFINTWNQEFPVEQDQLRTARTATTWLRENGLVDDAARTGTMKAGELEVLRHLREAIRLLAVANVTGSCDPSALRPINTAAVATPITFAIDDDGRIRLQTVSAGVDYAIGALLSIIHEAQIVGNWARLKGCRQCGYAFYDASKNRSAAWCSMSICGNRAKNRAYQQRQRNRTQA